MDDEPPDVEDNASPETTERIAKDGFIEYLTNPLGLRKSMSNAVQQKQQAQKILDTIPGSTVSEKLNPTTFRRLEYEGFIRDVLLKKMQPGTTRSYLCSMRHFLRYVKQEGIKDATSCDRCILYINTWYASMSVVAIERAQTVREEQDQEADDGEDPLVAYETSHNARSAVVLLGTAMSNEGTGGLTALDANKARNHLLTILGLTNAQRAGAVINIKMCEFMQRRNSRTRADKQVILVRQHKTYKGYGSARVVLSKQLALMVDAYVKYLRPKYVGAKGEDQQPLFLSATGEQMTHSLFTKSLKKQTGSDITLTKNRKIVVTRRMKRGATDQEMAELAQHMTHSTRTQHMYYDCSDRVEQSVETYQKLTESRGESPGKPCSNREEIVEASTDEEAIDDSGNAKLVLSAMTAMSRCPSTTCTITSLQARVSSCATDIITQSSAASITSSQARKHGRRAGYTEEQLATVERLFRTCINNKSVTTSEIRQILAAYPDETAKLSEYSVGQLKDKIRSYYRK
jgi:site-specific recombinase XerD